jgi:hypothetical protein
MGESSHVRSFFLARRGSARILSRSEEVSAIPSPCRCIRARPTALAGNHAPTQVTAAHGGFGARLPFERATGDARKSFGNAPGLVQVRFHIAVGTGGTESIRGARILGHNPRRQVAAGIGCHATGSDGATAGEDVARAATPGAVGTQGIVDQCILHEAFRDTVVVSKRGAGGGPRRTSVRTTRRTRSSASTRSCNGRAPRSENAASS